MPVGKMNYGVSVLKRMHNESIYRVGMIDPARSC